MKYGLAVLVAILGLLLVATPARAALPQVIIVLSEADPPYRDAASAASEALGDRVQVTLQAASRFSAPTAGNGTVYLTLGTMAFRAVLASAPTARIVAALIPRSAYLEGLRAHAVGPAPRTVTCVYLDQPFTRQMHLIRALTPSAMKIGLLTSLSSDEIVLRAHAAARANGMSIVHRRVESRAELADALAQTLDRADALLAIPDTEVFSPSTVHNILFAALRERKPVFAHAPAFVQAGALAAIYSTPPQIGRQAGRLVASLLEGGKVPEPQDPHEFEIRVNTGVANTLFVPVLEPSALVSRVRAMEGLR